MKCTILGAGNVGTAIATGTITAGHEVTVADVDADVLAELASQIPAAATTTDVHAAVADADVVVLAVPFGVVEELVAGVAESLAGTVVIDATNPLAADLSGLVTDEGPAGAQRVQQAAPDARVVKAFNTVFAGNQAVAEVDGVQLDGYVAGDDTDAKELVTELLEAVGYRVFDVGGLTAARYLEGMAYLNIARNAHNDLPWRSGWTLVGPVA
jgi:8-hydroxy-5-deazaflavin:NADPH oxidoreductase